MKCKVLNHVNQFQTNTQVGAAPVTAQMPALGGSHECGLTGQCCSRAFYEPLTELYQATDFTSVGIVWVGITGVAPAIVAYVIIASASAVAVFVIVSVATCVRRIFHLAIFAIGRMCVEQHVEKGKFAYKAPK